MLKKIFVTCFVLIVVVGPLVGIKVSQIKTLIASGANFQMPAETVSTAVVEEASWKQTLSAVGSLKAVQGVLVSSEVAGKITEIHFKSGETVEAGQLLVELDVSTELAQLAAAKADANLAKINLDRAAKLRESNTVAQAELDTANASYLAASAQVTNIEAILEKKRITAPFGGRLGIRMVDLGQYLNSGEPIVSLQSMDPIYVDFSFPQNWVSKISIGMPVEITVDAFPDRAFTGQLTAITPEIDESTRTIGLQGTLENPKGELLPGMFAQAAVVLPQEDTLKIMPKTAIMYASYGDSVFVVMDQDGQKTVEQRFVRLGESRGDFVSVTEGVEVGDTVVSAGAFKLRNGMSIMVNNSVSIDPQLDPKPEDS